MLMLDSRWSLPRALTRGGNDNIEDCHRLPPRWLRHYRHNEHTQELLPRGSATSVHRAALRLLEGMTADGGGYILAASHTIPPETPLENIFALYTAAGVSEVEIRDRAADLRRRH